MKRIFSLIVFTLTIASFTFAGDIKLPVAQGNTNRSLGLYTINEAGLFEMIKGDPLRAYQISYENSKDTITVAIDYRSEHLTRFLVISGDLVIEYVCNKDIFGARTIGERFEREGYSTSEDRLNRQEYYHQKILTREPMTETEYLCLISVYFPGLIKDYNKIYTKK
ncbi:MAG: hypothetical protein KFF49_04190 [Bacteroidales bacterium]|nr:hypothetical protein [Bacteroidales bacterium]